MARSSLSDKLIIYFIIIIMLAIGIVSIYSYLSAKDAQMERTYEQLTSVKYLKKKQLEQFYREQIQLAGVLADNEDLIQRFLQNSPLPDSYLGPFLKLEPYNYVSQFHLIAGRNIMTLVSNKSGDGIVRRSAALSPDSAARLSRTSMPCITDLKYRKEFNNWVHYIMVKVPGKGRPDNIFLVMELPSSSLDELMMDKDPYNGLGKSGETYLVGKDRLLRSNSRFVESAVMSSRIDEETIHLAFSGKEGTWLVNDYRGVEVLGSFATLSSQLPPWVLIAEMDFQEAMVPIYSIRNHVLFITVFIAALVMLLTWLIARKIIKPLRELTNAALELAKGKLETRVESFSNDEIGELAAAFNHMSSQLKEKEAMIIVEKNRRLKASFDAQDQERQRLSRELHDGLGQCLIAQKLQIETLDTGNLQSCETVLDDLKASSNRLIEEVRSMSNALMPAQLSQFGLIAAIRQHCEEVSKYGKLEVLFDATGNFDNLNKKVKMYLFRIVQEALNNTLKHAEATRASVDITQTREFIFLSISDNGKGFEIKPPCRGNGLNNMQERAELLLGSFSIESTPGAGTTIDIKIPIR